MMKKSFAGLAVVRAFVACKPAVVEVTVSVVPQPASITQYAGETSDAVVYASSSKLGPEDYIIDSRGGKVKVLSSAPAGRFYAEKTIDQIKLQSPEGKFPKLYIEDSPEFAYRGAHLDCCRHFWTVDQVKEYIDIMAMHKLNVFHWHLTEDQGWRFESKKYPKLQEIAAWRDKTIIRRTEEFDYTRHGGYYTQEEMKDVVAYAAEKFITVIPEIEMPGHATAALAAYPDLGCSGGPYEVEGRWGIFPDIFCVGKDETIKFLEDILDEVCEVFPSEYIHIGGDEAPRTCWIACPDCQARIKAEGLANEAELQSWLVNTIEKYLKEKGRKIIGWDEILEGGVSQSATVMSWRGTAGGKKAAALGNDVIMAPNKYYYLDYYQTDTHEEEPYSIGGHLNLRQSYSFDPYEDLDETAKAHIKGIQANVWTEYIAEWDVLQFHLLPRLAALSENAWNASGKTSYDAFVERVSAALLPQYEAKGWTYADFAFRNPPVE